MVNAREDFPARGAVLLLACAVLLAVAWTRGAEYDEQYTLFLTSGVPRPIWPEGPFPTGLAAAIQSGHAGLMTIANDLRRTDVHPPLYFWAVALWRLVGGDTLFAIRVLSVGFGLAALAAVGSIARRCAVPPALAMVLTLGCYGFAYTSGIARGFAMAQMLTLIGVAWAMRGRGFLSGAALGAAVLANYLAAFVAGAVVALVLVKPPNGTAKRPMAMAMVAGCLPFLTSAFWFFLAQRDSRTGQFPAFEMVPAMVRLGRYGAANLTGGLPLYVPDSARPLVAGVLAAAAAASVGLIVRRWRQIGTPDARRWLGVAAVAPPIGLLALGIVFDNTPIELRYLAFATPFFALLLAGAIQRSRGRRLILAAVLAVQAAAIAGLILRPETMQPARAAARSAAALAGVGVVLVPRGNDGVGIVGAFAGECPPALLLRVVGPADTAATLRAGVRGFDRVVLALLAQDDSSRTAIPIMRAAFAHPGWREIGSGSNVVAYQRTGDGE